MIQQYEKEKEKYTQEYEILKHLQVLSSND